MSRKRRNTSSPESDYSPPPKKSRSVISYDDGEEAFDYPENSKEQPRLNPTSGLHNAFPGLGDDGDELFYGPAADGVEYLRMVRSEAKGVPTLLLAQTNSIPKPQPVNGAIGDGEEGGLIYFDGTYTAAAKGQTSSQSTPDHRQDYDESLLDRFQRLRLLLRSSPPLEIIQALDPLRPISCPPDSTVAETAWEQHILSYDPIPAQVVSIDSESVLQAISIVSRTLGKLLNSPGGSLVSRVGSWAWALLARCPDRGELSSEEIAELRAFAAKAVDILEILEGVETVEINGDTEDQDEDVDRRIGRDETALMAKSEDAERRLGGVRERMNGMTDAVGLKPEAVVLDAIITIVGEFYGQRDLLEHRVAWIKPASSEPGALEIITSTAEDD